MYFDNFCDNLRSFEFLCFFVFRKKKDFEKIWKKNWIKKVRDHGRGIAERLC